MDDAFAFWGGVAIHAWSISIHGPLLDRYGLISMRIPNYISLLNMLITTCVHAYTRYMRCLIRQGVAISCMTNIHLFGYSTKTPDESGISMLFDISKSALHSCVPNSHMCIHLSDQGGRGYSIHDSHFTWNVRQCRHEVIDSRYPGHESTIWNWFIQCEMYLTIC